MKNETFYNNFFRGLEDHSFVGASIIHSTLRSEDLLPAFFELLKSFDPEKAEEIKGKYPDIEKALKSLKDGESNISYFETEESTYLINEVLLNELNKFAPEGFYFGSNEGNTSDFGFWLDSETYEIYYKNNWL